ncbi:hypothetical protein LINPERPRIM_LOCUS1090 [Linum perenne]
MRQGRQLNLPVGFQYSRVTAALLQVTSASLLH